ncbi:hypothetical protein R5H30_11650 [Sulfitobacter sp. D35]|uniref:hypothetical protein n=1 Tax=Sulfitobacter sp. D35 TaxID=3083252 RepID=UPI00296F2050|nr:hypothetical protein [Sulfitobacter sp. D35]MDW4498639.1 hypothetical protein [Sulfitobacter sp. D35]
MKPLLALLIVLLAAAPLRASGPYDLIFKTGTLSDLSGADTLIYDRRVEIGDNPDYAARNTGQVELDFQPDEMARLRFFKDGKHRKVGLFPATVGNPIVMYFVETVLRDVAQEAGGSPFYIRNRIKDALIQEAPVEEVTVNVDGAEIAAQRVTLRPFEHDKNRPRMGPYGDLSLTFTMSEALPGWYGSLVAEAPAKDGRAGYRNALTLVAGEDG